MAPKSCDTVTLSDLVETGLSYGFLCSGFFISCLFCFSGRPSNASYENEDELRLNLINGSTSTDYANTRPYNDEDEAVV